MFFSALFYLLSNSDKKYYPLVVTHHLGFASGDRIADAIEQSISSVLIANAKLVMFHGLFMWLTHTLFGARVVFLPAGKYILFGHFDQHWNDEYFAQFLLASRRLCHFSTRIGVVYQHFWICGWSRIVFFWVSFLCLYTFYFHRISSILPFMPMFKSEHTTNFNEK